MTRVDGKFIKDWVENEVPSGAVNSANTVFTITHQPSEPMAVEVFVNGLRQRYTTDFTVGGTLNKTITFTTAPTTDSNVWVSYTRETGE